MTQLGSILVPEAMFDFGIYAYVEINNLYVNWH